MKTVFRFALTVVALLIFCAAAQKDRISQLGKLPADARAPIIAQLAKLTASDGQSYDQFGSSVAVDGNTIAIGAPNNGGGAVYVFVKPPGGWANATQTAKLIPSDDYGDYLGGYVSIAGNTIATGGGEKIYVYVEPPGGWHDMTETALLTASDQNKKDGFGNCGISEDGSIILGGSAGIEGDGIGKAYIFEKPAGGWVNMAQTAELRSTDGKYTGFGSSCGISGNAIVVGAPDTEAGYIFVEPPGGWKNMTQTARLTATGGPQDDFFGASVAIGGNNVVIGAPLLGQFVTGAVYEFTKPSGGWVNMTQTAELLASNPSTNEGLGSSVSISGKALAAGAPSNCCGQTSPGAVYGFVEPNGGWQNETQKIELMSSDDSLNAEFGWSVAMSDKTLVVGAYQANGAQGESGAAYVFGLQP